VAAANWVAVVAVTVSDVEVLPAEPADELARLMARCSELAVGNELLWDEAARLAEENERLRARIVKLESELVEARRAAKRQAAPFSRGEPSGSPGRPGRRSGEQHGRHGHRQPPVEVDEEFDAPLVDRCECGGEIVEERIEFRYQDELPEPKRVRRRFAVHVGKCSCCGRRHQGRHPYQTSDALGAASCMLGPRAVALATELNKELGLSPQKTAKALARFGIQITPGGVVQAIARQARVLEPTYEAVVEGARSSRAVAPDETGWRINGQKAWLWRFAGEDLTVYLIARGRGYEQAVEILGEKFSGVLERDGWAPYRRFANARHQTCAAHLLRRTGELIADSVAGQARVRHATRRILKDALASRDQRQTKRPLLPILLWDVEAPDRLEPVALVARRVDDALDLAQRHAVRGLCVGSRRYRSLVGVDAPVGQQVQLRVEQLPIQLVQRQATRAATTGCVRPTRLRGLAGIEQTTGWPAPLLGEGGTS